MTLSDFHHNHVQQGLDALNRKRYDIDRYWSYYDDIQPPVWLNENMRELFRGLNDRFSLNLCKLAINTPLNRLWVESWGQDAFKNMWQELHLDREQKRIYKHALVAGESYVIGWRDEQGPKAGFNDARTVHLFYEVDDPGTKEYAIKVWQDANEVVRCVLYYPDEIVRLLAPAPGQSGIVLLEDPSPIVNKARVSASSFEYDPVDPGGGHDIGEVPVWRFSKDLWRPQSHLEELIPVQDVINKLRANKMVASETGAFPQRVYLTMQDLDERKLVAEPRSALVLDPGDRESPTSVEEFDAAPLKNYDDSIRHELENFFSLANLPRNLLIGSGYDRSGDAVRSDEGPFQEMIRDIETNFGYSWTDLAHALHSSGEWDKPDWQDARINNSEAQAREFKTLVEAQMPPAFAAMKAFQWSKQEAEDAGLATTMEQVANLADRSPATQRTQTTEDEAR